MTGSGVDYTEAMGNKKLQLRLTADEWRALELLEQCTGQDRSSLARRGLSELAARLLGAQASEPPPAESHTSP